MRGLLRGSEPDTVSSPARLALLAVILASPALAVGFRLDDYFHLAVLEGMPGWPEIHRAPLGLFDFSPGDPAEVMRLKERGMLAWWASEDFRLSFFRPVSALTHCLDHALWPTSAPLAHLHSLGWLAALVAMATATYRRLLPDAATVAGLAALLFAVDDARAMPAGWLANRNALISAFFALLTLNLHDRWRAGWRPGALLAPLCLLIGLLAGEAAAAAGGFLVAHALFREPTRRPAVLLPYLGVGLLWQVGYRLLQAGARGSGLYSDPSGDPLGFLLVLPQRLLTLLGGAWGLGMLEVAWVVDVGWWPALAGLVLLLIVLAPLWPLRDPMHRFWLLGTLLALVPTCAVMPSDRLLCIAGFGTAGLLAESLSSPAVRRAPRVLLLTINLGLAAILLPLRILGLTQLGGITAGAVELPDEIADQTLVIANGSDATAGYLSLVRMGHQRPLPQAVWTLSSAFSAATYSRPDAVTLIARPDQGWQALPIERLLRDTAPPAEVGDVVALSGMTAEVLAVTGDGRMAEVRFTFAAPLEAPRWRWLMWTPTGLEPWQPPDIGQQSRIELPMLP